MIKLANIVQVNEYLLTTEVGGEIVMLDAEAGRYFNLDLVGSTIWRALEQPQEVAALCRSLGERFDAEAGVIEHDVLAFLNRLLSKKLIVVRA